MVHRNLSAKSHSQLDVGNLSLEIPFHCLGKCCLAPEGIYFLTSVMVGRVLEDLLEKLFNFRLSLVAPELSSGLSTVPRAFCMSC